MVSPFRAVSRRHENELIELPEFSKYQYGVGFMSVANPSLGALGQPESTLCLSCKEEVRFQKLVALAVVEDRRPLLLYPKVCGFWRV